MPHRLGAIKNCKYLKIFFPCYSILDQSFISSGERRTSLSNKFKPKTLLLILMKKLLPLLILFIYCSSSFGGETPKHPNRQNFSVFSYGAVGDGIKDDTPAFQAAVSAASAAGGGDVIVPRPPVSYYLADTLNMKDNVRLIGTGRPLLKIGDSKFINASGKNMEISNFRIESDKNNGVQCIEVRSNLFFHWGQSENIRIDNNEFRNCKMGIKSAHFSKKVVIENNIFEDCTYGMYLYNIQDFKILKNIFKKTRRPIETYNARRTVISDNQIEGSRSGTIVGIMLGTNRTYDSDGPSDNVVTRNTVLHTQEEGIMFEEVVANAFVSGGIVTSATSMTLSESTKTWKVASGNILNDTGFVKNRDVILVSGKGEGQHRKVVANTSDTLTIDKAWEVIPDKTTKYVIVKAIKNNQITDNYIEDTGRQGILIYGPSIGNTISGNTIKNGGMDKGYSGIGLVGTSGQGGNKEARHPSVGNMVLRNKISGSNQAGIQVFQVNYWKSDFSNLNNQIEGNSISDVPDGVLIQSAKYTLVGANDISSVRTGIREEKASDHTVVDKKNRITQYDFKDIVISGQHTSRE